ncbi:type II toxin-antitoxin system VapC family toxin [uncultured Sphingomonas sp.]|uniref:type II toxin-antitoxin system VapC family toxin n=1 Tax=uncultured Sphingomonas sp. TaxID=158754 RepID=UPI0035C97445
MIRLLLDTHAALFWWSGSAKLGVAARDAIADADAAIFVSAASAWEVATKFRIGKLDDIGDPVEHYPRLMAHHGFETLGITMVHGLRAGAMPGTHRDPFDRLIAAQALIEDLTVITRDREIAKFGCKVLW